MRGAFDDLPDELVCRIMETAAPSALHALMRCSSRLRSLGALSGVWLRWINRQNLPPPRPNARVYKRYYDVYLKNACKLCMERKADSLATCRICSCTSHELRSKFERWTSFRCLRRSSLLDISEARERIREEEQILIDAIFNQRVRIAMEKHAKRQYVDVLRGLAHQPAPDEGA